MARSSSVGMTKTLTRLLSLLIRRSLGSLASLRLSQISIPIWVWPAQTSLRMKALFSPMPPVKTTASRRPRTEV